MGLRGKRVGEAFLAVVGGVLVLVLWGALPGKDAFALERNFSPRAGEECESCHRPLATGGHPLHVEPRQAKVPVDWPLDPEGRVTCTTCHLDCGRGEASPRAALQLRGGILASELCAVCHGDREGAQARASQTSLLSMRPFPVAMNAAERHSRTFAVAHPSSSVAGGGELDGSSRRCMGCHDGTVGTAGELSIDAAPHLGARETSHPLGTGYPPRPRAFTDNAYVPAGSLDRRISLPDGRVGCVSCHDLYSNEASLLVISNVESRLCYACHDL